MLILLFDGSTRTFARLLCSCVLMREVDPSCRVVSLAILPESWLKLMMFQLVGALLASLFKLSEIDLRVLESLSSSCCLASNSVNYFSTMLALFALLMVVTELGATF